LTTWPILIKSFKLIKSEKKVIPEKSTATFRYDAVLRKDGRK